MIEDRTKNLPASLLKPSPVRQVLSTGMRNSFFSKLSIRYLNMVHRAPQKKEEEQPLGYESSWAGIYPEHKE